MPPVRRVPFLPTNPPLIIPRLSSRQRREETVQRPSSWRKWGKPLVITFFVIGVLVLFIFFYLGVKAGILPGEFVH